MLGEYPDTTKGQYLASLLLKEDDSPKRPEQDRRASPGRLHGFRHRAIQEGSSNDEGIQGQTPLELITDTFQWKSNITIDRVFFMRAPAITTLDLDSAPMVVSPNPPKAFAAQWEVSEVLQPSVSKTQFPTTDVGGEHTGVSIMPYSRMRQILGRSAIKIQWDDNMAYSPSSHSAGFLPVTLDWESIDKEAVWTEILERFDVIAQREDDWDGLESKKPIEESLVHGKRLIEKLLADILFAGYSWHMFKPLISSDEDGYITVRWRGQGKRLHLLIEEDEVRYIKSWRINTKRKVSTERTRSDNCFEIWEWLING